MMASIIRAKDTKMGFDKDRFSEHLRKIAGKASQRKCARHVRLALEAAGANTSGHPVDAKLWGPTLRKIGFRELVVEDPSTFTFLKGDIVVLQPYAGGSTSGHIAGYDGKMWISDFLQQDLWSGAGYRKHKPGHVFFRL